MTTQFDADIEDILRERFPLKPLFDAVEPLTAALAAAAEAGPRSTDKVDPARKTAEIARARAEYRAMEPARVSQLAAESRVRMQQRAERQAAEQMGRAEAKRAAKERLRFYNQPEAAADFAFWCKADYWTADDAAALLLGRDPRRVNAETLAQELSKATGLLGHGERPSRSKFHDEYDGLKTLLSRAEALGAPRLLPASVRAWAERTGTPVPSGLLAALVAVKPAAIEADEQAHQSLLADPVADGASPTKWTPAKLAELRAYRDKHSTKAASEKFGISAQRIRQLLPREPAEPKKPQPYSIFNRRPG